MDSVTNLVSSGPLHEALGFAGSILALIILTAILFLFAMRSGRAMLTAFILSLYVGYSVYSFFPYTEQVVGAAGTTPLTEALASLAVFAVFAGLSYFLMRRVAGGGYLSVRPVPLLILAVLTAGFLLALGFHSFRISDIYELSPTLHSLFGPDKFFFYWFIAPLAALFLLAR